MNYVIDLETTGLNYITDTIIGVAEANDSIINGKYTNIKDVNKQELQDTLLNNTIIFHNAKFDLHFLQRAGYVLPTRVHDTMLMAHLINENVKANLEYSCIKYLNVPAWKQDVKKFIADNKCGYANLLFDDLKEYAEKDASYTYSLFKELYPIIKAQGLEQLYNQELALMRALVDIEDRGVLIKLDYIDAIMPILETQKQKAETEIYKIAGKQFNINSDDELAQVLYIQLNLPILERAYKTNKPKVDEDVLLKLQHPICEHIINYRNASHMLSTYCLPIKEKTVNNILRCDLFQIGARTGRFSSRNLNLQNIPTLKVADIRQAFICRPEYTNFYFDYKQMEYVGYAFFSNDPYMKAAIMAGKDLHLEMAKKFYKKEDITDTERSYVKTLNFGILYGMGVKGLAKKFNKTYEEAQAIRQNYFNVFPIMKQFNTYIMDKIKHDGFVQNPFGRKRRLTIDEAYKGVNALVQGTCSDIMKRGMIKLYALLQDKKSNLLLTIHDELIVEIHDTELNLVPIIKNIMEDNPDFSLPFKVDIKCTQTNWADKKVYKGGVTIGN